MATVGMLTPGACCQSYSRLLQKSLLSCCTEETRDDPRQLAEFAMCVMYVLAPLTFIAWLIS